MSKYQMSIEMNVIKHLGINLYSNAVAVISEVIANSWDADATEVRINTAKDDDCFLTISDNGSGMDIDDINEKFLCVGYQKREKEHNSEKFGRPFMGRKGIGKLSLFSIAEEIEVQSCKNGQKNGFILDINEIDKIIKEKKSEYSPREIDEKNISINNGTLIRLRRPRKNFKRLDERLKTKIARRFSVFSETFKVFVDDEEVTFEDRDYFSKIDYMWHLSPKKERYYSQYSFEKEKEISCEVPIVSSNSDLFERKTFPIRGWIGSVKETTSLKENGESINKITVVVRGKVAKEDILPEIKEDRLFKMYLIGELHIDYFDNDELDEMSISNRQDFNEEDLRYKDAILKITDVIKKTIAVDWNEWKDNKGVENALKNEALKEWYGSLKGDSKATAKKLFSKIEKMTVHEKDKKEILKHGILAFERLRLMDTLSSMDTVMDAMTPQFQGVFNTIDDLEAVLYHDIVKGRVDVIKELERKVSLNEREKIIQRYLFDHLWLLDPSWERATGCPANMEKTVQTIFDEINNNLTDDERRGRVDIQYKLSSGKHIIIELKRPERDVNVYELLEQGDKYICAFEKMFQQRQMQNEVVNVIFVLGKKLKNWDNNRARDADIKALASKNMRVVFYQEMIENALKAYNSFLEKHKELSKIQNVINSL